MRTANPLCERQTCRAWGGHWPVYGGPDFVWPTRRPYRRHGVRTARSYAGTIAAVYQWPLASACGVFGAAASGAVP
jgi:hypothetical protein